LTLGLVPGLPRKNCWSIAEWAGQASPDGMQPLPGRAEWDADAVRDDVREYVLEHPHDDEGVDDEPYLGALQLVAASVRQTLGGGFLKHPRNERLVEPRPARSSRGLCRPRPDLAYWEFHDAVPPDVSSADAGSPHVSSPPSGDREVTLRLGGLTDQD
jgi:hypothetical protein